MIKQAVFLTDNEKLNLDPKALYDRIINLKLNCFNEETLERESFVIRSDYELIYPDKNIPLDGTVQPSRLGKCIIRRCTQKPSIKVNYKMVTGSVGTSVDIYVSNFFMLTKDGNHLRSFNSSKYRMESVEVAMGYWGQFRVGKESDYGAPSYEDYFKIKAEKGADKVTLVAPIVVTTEKLPPDSVLHIKGYVAHILSSPVAVSKAKDVQEALDNAIKNPVASSDEGLEEVFYRGITRRYLNEHYFTDGDKEDNRKKLVKVSDTTSAVYNVQVSVDSSTAYLSKEDADEYGVKVYLSDRVKEIELPKAKDGEGNEITKKIYFEQGWTIGHTVARIGSFLRANLDYTFNKKGEILIFTTDEVNDPDSLYQAFNEQGAYKDSPLGKSDLYDHKLPAVYNINIDAVATIVCPFFTFLEPFQEIEFASRYALTSVVSYFASYSPTVYKFKPINATISFATVDDVNEVQITAVANGE